MKEDGLQCEEILSQMSNDDKYASVKHAPIKQLLKRMITHIRKVKSGGSINALRQLSNEVEAMEPLPNLVQKWT